MYAVSSDYKTAIAQSGRKFTLRVTHAGVQYTDAVQSITYKQQVDASNRLTMGTACASTVTIVMLSAQNIAIYVGDKITCECGLSLPDGSVEWVPLGVFFVKSISSKDNFKTVTINAGDALEYMSSEYIPDGIAKLPVSFKDLAIDVARQADNNVFEENPLEDFNPFDKSTVWPNISFSEIPSNVQVRGMLGYLAGCIGCFVKITRDGKIKFDWYTDNSVVITPEMQFLDGFSRSSRADSITVTSIVSGTQDAQISIGSSEVGAEISFNDPMITQEMLDDIWQSKIIDAEGNSKVVFTPGNVKWIGDPAIDAGDIVVANDKDGNQFNIYIMTRTTTLSGGCVSTETCSWNDTITLNFSTGGTNVEKIQRAYSSLLAEIKRVTEQITGVDGGYVVLNYDINNQPYEILIMDSPNINEAENVWRFNQNGIGHSSSGYNGAYTTAMTMDGLIIGSMIAANTISGESLDIESVIETINNNSESQIDSAKISVNGSSLEDAIRLEVSRSGGSNVIKNSVGAFGVEEWDVSGTVSALENADDLADTISKGGFLLSVGEMSQTLQLAAEIDYTLSFRVKKDAGNASVSLNDNIVWSDTDEISTWEHVVVNIPSSNISESVLTVSSPGGAMSISDLMLCPGSNIIWQQAPGEISGIAVKLNGRALRVEQPGADTITEIDSEGTKVLSARSGDIVAQYDINGTITKTLTSDGFVRAGNARMVPIDSDSAVMWVID